MVQKKILELWVGLFVALGLVAVGILAFKVGNLSAADVANSYRLIAEFDNIGGLKVRAPVTLAGVRIGRVSEIYVNKNDFRAVVEMNIDGRYDNLPTDTTALVLTSGVLGEQYVGVEPGGDSAYLKDGDRIILTQSALVLESLVGQFLFGKAAQGDK
jgi:phospholipid/cholesterol/gamma-HCH transport system substrate-binding protein